jgi:hypothetical protein
MWARAALAALWWLVGCAGGEGSTGVNQADKIGNVWATIGDRWNMDGRLLQIDKPSLVMDSGVRRHSIIYASNQAERHGSTIGANVRRQGRVDFLPAYPSPKVPNFVGRGKLIAWENCRSEAKRLRAQRDTALRLLVSHVDSLQHQDKPASPRDISRGGVSDIVYDKLHGKSSAVGVESERAVTVSTKDRFEPRSLACYQRIPGRSHGIACGDGGVSRVNQRSPDQKNTGCGQKHFRNPESKHTGSPFGQVLLYIQIVSGTLLFGGGIVVIVCGFQCAGNALDAVLDGNRYAWLRVVLWFGSSVLGAGLAGCVVTYALSVCGAC